jgi:UDPglucose 6-dehydrogenase
MTYQPDLTLALTSAELVILGTEWTQYKTLDPTTIPGGTGPRTIIDARNALDPTAWRTAGWTYRALGRPAT